MKIQKKPGNKAPLPDGYYRCETCKGTGKVWVGIGSEIGNWAVRVKLKGG